MPLKPSVNLIYMSIASSRCKKDVMMTNFLNLKIGRRIDARWLKRNLQYSSYNETYSEAIFTNAKTTNDELIDTYQFRRSKILSHENNLSGLLPGPRTV